MPSSPAPLVSAAASVPLLSDDELLDVLSQIDQSAASLTSVLVAADSNHQQQQRQPPPLQVDAIFATVALCAVVSS